MRLGDRCLKLSETHGFGKNLPVLELFMLSNHDNRPLCRWWFENPEKAGLISSKSVPVSAEGRVEHQKLNQTAALLSFGSVFGVQLDNSCRLKCVSANAEKRVFGKR